MKEQPRMRFFQVFAGGASRSAAPKTSFESLTRICAIALSLTLAADLMACQTPKVAPPPPAPPRQIYVPPPAPPGRAELPNYYRLRNTPRETVPARVALLLPFSSPSADVRNIADALQKAAELALFDSGSRDIL